MDVDFDPVFYHMTMMYLFTFKLNWYLILSTVLSSKKSASLEYAAHHLKVGRDDHGT